MAKKIEKTIKKSEKEVGTLEKARQELFTMKVDHSLRKLKNTRSLFLKRKEIARMLTAANMQSKGVNK